MTTEATNEPQQPCNEPLPKPVENNTNIIPKDKNALKSSKSSRGLNQRQLSFCSYMVTGLSGQDAYCKAYNVQPCESTRVKASHLLSKVSINNEIDRLRKSLITGSMVERVKQMGSKALDTIDNLMGSAKSESVQLEASKTVIDRLLPKTTISINQNIKVDNARLEAMKRIYLEEAERKKAIKVVDAVIVDK